ncbi:fused MFS/spermidine synthase [Candidatus Uhrbacteria bacterium]|nr:fused MFS/spermidine synthase [Candidatus Uhrbacteria bacterium]
MHVYHIKNKYLEFSVFIAGAVVMVLELVGVRALAPYVGTSIVVWTNLIGIILASLSIGYYWGGRRADVHASDKEFFAIIFFAGILIASTAFLKDLVLTFLTALCSDIRISAALGTIILFAPASTLLGMISPYAAKLKMNDLAHAGATVGTLYALSTIGSIIGTFVAGFFLITYFGNTNIMYMLAIILLLTSMGAYRSVFPWKHIIPLLIILLCMGFAASAQSYGRKTGNIDEDTKYQHVQIFTTTHPQNGRKMRVLTTDAAGIQSGAYLDSDELPFEYAKLFHLAIHFQPNLSRTLMIGGGAYSYPRAFLKKFPKASIDVVELDSKLTELARTYFDLKDDPRLHIFHEDGRMFINRMEGTYDAVYIDAFHSLAPPFQLTTKEVAKKLYDHLSANGVVLMNIASAVEGPGSEFMRAEYATYKNVFPTVEIFPVLTSDTAGSIRSIVLLAYKSEKPIVWESDDAEIQGYLQKRWPKKVKDDISILTDEYAPVEQYLLRAYQEVFKFSNRTH